jgi:O-methyltransferase involved in polyketide biosynthesis
MYRAMESERPDALFHDFDLPAMQDYKREALAAETPRCALEWAPADLAQVAERRAVLARVAGGPGPALVITEGLLVYLDPDQVTGLARDLHACAPLAWWLTDLASPRLIKMMERTWGRRLRAGGAPFKFAPAEGTAFFEPLRWREAEFRSNWEEALRLNRTMRGAKFWNFVGRFYPKKTRESLRRMAGIVLLERR